jgi:transposase-like protein
MANETEPGPGERGLAAQAQRETHWRRVVERWKASGQPKTVFCAREGINPPSLHRWLRELERRDGSGPREPGSQRRRAGNAPRFVPVRIAMSASTAAAPPIEVQVGEHRLRVSPGFDPETLRQVLQVLSATRMPEVPRC